MVGPIGISAGDTIIPEYVPGGECTCGGVGLVSWVVVGVVMVEVVVREWHRMDGMEWEDTNTLGRNTKQRQQQQFGYR